ncbi:MAG: hypothetical protein LV473_19735 [Nitrospira sp.]|nr:hypothetical protein [Nitrospira sp.]
MTNLGLVAILILRDDFLAVDVVRDRAALKRRERDQAADITKKKSRTTLTAACTDSYQSSMPGDDNDQARPRKHRTKASFALRVVEAHARMPTDGLASFGGSAVCLD